MPPLTFHTPLTAIHRVGAATATRLKKLGITNAGELLAHLPVRHDDLSQVTTLAQAPVGEITTVKVRIDLITNRRSPRKRMMITEAIGTDETESIKIIWFNQPFIAKNLQAGDEVYLSGKIDEDHFGRHFKNPSYEKVQHEQTHTARIVPIYPLTEGLTQKQMRFLIQSVIPLTQNIHDWVPQEITTPLRLIPLATAWSHIHFPPSQEDRVAARHRLAFDELFLIQLYNLKTRQELQKMKAPRMNFQEKETKEFVKALPFALTEDQRKTAWEIIKDLGKEEPMNRLLQGEVGSGKTVVGTIAMYNAILNGYQGVLMAPTEILAFQHFQTVKKLLGTKNISAALLTNTYAETYPENTAELPLKTRREKIKTLLREGKISAIIGTQSLLQEDVSFEHLGLAIIDEQHRFGVEQRKKLREHSGDSKTFPHFLSMTATPIPRSLALTFYGDLDVSSIRSMPRERQPITTHVIRPDQRNSMYLFIREEIQKGRQAFVICPLIEESDKLGVRSATAEYERLHQEIFPDLEIGLLHGKMKGKEKETVMNAFKENKIHILVSTSVVEVGVDIPNATIMMIEGADRFGLSQLHQFRGRVGRGEHKSYCLLFSDSENPFTLQRLQLLTKYQDGFSLAEHDLTLRGPGNIYGSQQSGFVQLKIATWQDQDIMIQAKKEAVKLLTTDPTLSSWPLLSKKFERFSGSIHLE